MRVDAMTTHYFDLTVIPDPETTAPQLLGTLFGRLHQALALSRTDDIGVSFPRYSKNPRSIGNILRLHGTDAGLQRLMSADWLKGVRDHVRMTEISPVPGTCEHRTVTRKQYKTSAARLRRRRMKRKGESAEEAAQAIPSTVERKPDLPYIHLRSHSTGQSFHLFIVLGPAQLSPVTGLYNTYGFGGRATIPWF